MLKIRDLHIKVTDEIAEKVRRLAKDDRRTVTETLTIAVENYLKLRKVQ